MTGELEQRIALTTYGNHWLRSGVLPDGFYPMNGAFRYCNTVGFRVIDRKKESVVATDPLVWFRYLQKEGCRGLRLHYRAAEERLPAKEHQLAGFVGGGGVWRIEAVYAGHCDFWASRWQVTRKDDPDNHIWCVNYGRTEVGIPTLHPKVDLVPVAAELQDALEAITRFSHGAGLDFWAEFFQKAAARLAADEPAAGFHNEALVPPGDYDLQAQRVLFTAGSAWAFGGMGTWNDVYIPNPVENDDYDKVSKRLYDAFNKAVVAAVNSVSLVD